MDEINSYIMCGVVAAIGKVDKVLLSKLMIESEVRGIHYSCLMRVSDKCFIGHTRYSTSGNDNQPLQLGAKILAFNGVIDMSTKKEMEKRWKIKMQTDNDGEIFLRLCNDSEDALRFVTETKDISFAGVFTFDSKYLYAIANEKRPLWQAVKNGSVYIASTADIFERSGITHYKPLDDNRLYVWKIPK